MKNNRIVPGCSGMIPNRPNKKSRSYQTGTDNQTDQEREKDIYIQTDQTGNKKSKYQTEKSSVNTKQKKAAQKIRGGSYDLV